MSDELTPIVFLDIDGVLNHRESFKPGMPGGNKRFAPECVAQLNRFLSSTGAEIVVSSTWRTDPDITEVLLAAGVSGKVIGTTPVLRDGAVRDGALLLPIPRGFEIALWMHWHGEKRPFVIFDDDSDMQPVEHRHVRTIFADGGLMASHVDAALAMLQPVEPTAPQMAGNRKFAHECDCIGCSEHWPDHRETDRCKRFGCVPKGGE